jgi:tetratricopeptide (TPR) repeat protein
LVKPADDGTSAYGAREVAALLGLTVPQIRRFVRAGVLSPERGSRGELRFSFQDLAFLRLVKQLSAERVAPRRVHRALRRLREQIPEDQPLSGVRLDADGGGVVARRLGEVWDPESGQRLFDFVDESAGEPVDLGERGEASLEVRMSAEDWYRLGCELHEGDPEHAREAYGRALGLDNDHVDARVNLGCLHHAGGKLEDAEAAYRAALELRPGDAIASFDLAVVLEDLGRLPEAAAAYERTLELEPRTADAHYNLARLYDRVGDTAAAIRHLRSYRQLTER